MDGDKVARFFET